MLPDGNMIAFGARQYDLDSRTEHELEALRPGATGTPTISLMKGSIPNLWPDRVSRR